MESWKEQKDIKKKLDGELSGMIAEEGKLREILNSAGMDIFEEMGGVKMGKITIQKGNRKSRSMKTIVKVAFIAAALTVVSVGSVFGYEYVQRMYQQVKVEKYQDHLNQAESNAPVYNVEDSKKSENIETNVDALVVE